ncbi:transglycosylase domain-containing protein [Defluviitalea raffinosedens]|uniref:transglycosylase domain-containing protein n=1 Tax=Defluviitalea raffinosedens TaxID=1450156 RepID=UPI001958ECF5|nr:PBP1A family penicillin-binding protein [Defluviitalea raffinosedens]MBM7687076.1 penicillin-binding protein 1A [Defluviitalea raffinosedens]
MNFSKESNDKKKSAINSKNKKVKKRLSIIIFRIIFVIMIFGAFAAVGGGLGVFLGIVNTAPDIKDIKLSPKEYTSIIYDLNGNEIDRLHGDENRVYAELDQIPKHLQQAFIAIEDERFYSHNGIDLKGILRAVVVNIKEHSFSEGASTITQQLIKNRVLTTEKKIERKLQEQYLAIQLEKIYDKDQILEWYLNEIGLGHGLNGVQAAANRYFNKDVSELTLAESAVIAAITQNPSRYSPINHPENNRERQKIVLLKMLEQRYITQSEYDEAINEDVYSKVQETSQQYVEDSKHSYYVDQIIESVINDLQIKKGYTATEATNMLYSGGLSIYTPFNQEMQRIVDKYYAMDEFYPPKSYELKVVYNVSIERPDGTQKHLAGEGIIASEDEIEDFKAQKIEDWGITERDKIIKEQVYTIPQPQSAMVIMDYHNGHVLAIAGGRGEKIGNLMFNRATHAKRQPGSAFKVLAAYAPALDTGKVTPGTVIDDVPLQVKDGSSKKYINNWTGRYEGLSTVREGIYNSMNVLAVKTLIDTGIDTSFDYLQHFGFTTLIDHEERNGRVFTDKNPVLALGGITDGVTPLELTAAYATIANNGVYNEPVFYTKILDHDGNLLIDNTPQQRRVLKETTAFLLTDMMKDVITRGTGTLARFKNINMPIAGKTGTTSDDKDLVFVGYTPYYAAGIWLGHDTPKKMRYDKSYHNLLWSAIMEEIHKELPIKKFEVPSGIVQARICTESGKLATSTCEHDPRGSTAKYEYFEQGTQPKEYCDVHKVEKVCTVSGLLANEYCPEETVKEKVFIVRPVPYVPASSNGPYPADAQYELPVSKEKSSCNVHGPNSSSNTDPNNSDGFTIPEADNNGVITLPGNGGNTGNTGNSGNSGNTGSPTPGTPPDTTTPDSSITDTPSSMDDFYVPLP